jgi:ParB family chromosome partitioning protein
MLYFYDFSCYIVLTKDKWAKLSDVEKQFKKGLLKMLKTSSKAKANCQIQLIPHEAILPNPHQPRVRFDYIELENLAESIRANGILQPINVRPLENGGFELISGERRLRAARMIGINKIPCIVMNVSDEQSALFALIENVQRQNLDFFEEAVAIERLMTEHFLSQEEIGKRLGKAQSTLSNKLRLLRLPEEMRDRIVIAGLSERHARALLSLPDNPTRERALDIIIERHLTVSEAERLINDIIRRKKEPTRAPIRVFKDMRIFINTLNHAVDSIRRAGIEADTAKSETDEYFEYVVRISKPCSKNVTTQVVDV